MALCGPFLTDSAGHNKIKRRAVALCLPHIRLSCESGSIRLSRRCEEMNVVLSVLAGAAAVEIKRHFDKDKEKQRRARALDTKEQELRQKELELQALQVSSLEGCTSRFPSADTISIFWSI